ncbi:MAG: hypothetical protein GC160_03385 [Acidobacteria bacterium]|nr:hypothetical protein [Acidobacteriota bacterium]
MVSLPNNNLRRRIERMERRLPRRLTEPEVIIRVFGNEEQGGYTISEIRYGTHTETFVYDLDPDEYAEFMSPMEGEDCEPADIPEPGEPSAFRAPSPEPEPEPAPNPPVLASKPAVLAPRTPIRITPSDGPRHLDPVLAYHLRLPQTAAAPAVRNEPPPPHRDFLSPAAPGAYGVVSNPRLTFSSPQKQRTPGRSPGSIH